MGTVESIAVKSRAASPRVLLTTKFVLLAALAYGIAFGMSRIVLAHGNSVPHTILWASPGMAIARGDYVKVTMHHPIIGPKPADLTKQVTCDEGDYLSLRGDAFYCNKSRLGGFITETWDGKPLTPFQFDGRIPDGKAFLMGSHPRSFDSRYFGLVDKSELTRLRAIL